VSDLPELLQLTEIGERRFRTFQPAEYAEGRDVVFSGQFLAQMLMASAKFGAGDKNPRSIHAVFARAGSYHKQIELEVESMQAGRTWASDTVTATQDGKLLCRSIVLLTTVDPDLMRHGPEAPSSVPGPESLQPGRAQAFPGAEMRPISDELTINGVPAQMAWHRFERSVEPGAAGQAILAWATCGEIIGLAMRPNRSTIRIEDAHQTLSTGVIAHTIHFVDTFDVGEWLLIITEATKAAAGRVFGGGSVFTEDGRLVAVFHQDAMARAVEGQLDRRRSM